jgi:hypothetical protein
MTTPAQLYFSHVLHRRALPPRNRFRYRVFSLLIDLDRLDEAERSSRLFGVNRWRPISFHEADHGPRDGLVDGGSLRHWIDRKLADAGIDLAGGRVRLLCFPRLFGYTFNPLSLWFCEHADGRPRAVLAEVHNTFGERHSYWLQSNGEPLDWPIRASRQKCFHVSPFLGMQGRYDFRIAEPGEQLSVHIRETRDGKPVLFASQWGDAQPLDDRHLLRALIRTPLGALQAFAAIHWQALRLWLRGAKFHTKPPAPREEIS